MPEWTTIAEALKPGTSQHDYLSDLNASVTSNNTSLPRGQRQSRKNAFTVERAFKYEKLEREAKKGGLDFVWYAFNVYEGVLLSTICTSSVSIQAKTSILLKTMWVYITKARRLLADHIHEHNIRFLDTAANSPDLQPIESLTRTRKKSWTNFGLILQVLRPQCKLR
jgi:hypothetical protein